MYKIPNCIELNEQKFISAFVIIPSEEDTLDLSEQIYNRTSYELAQGFEGMPSTVTAVHLNTNILGLRNIEEIKEIARGLPSTVTKVCLKNNGFHFAVSEFKEVFDAMPHVTQVELQERDEHLKQIGSAEAIADMFAFFKKITFSLHGNSPLVEKIKEHYSQFDEYKKQSVNGKRDAFFQNTIEVALITSEDIFSPPMSKNKI